jgi:hypothetical protein
MLPTPDLEYRRRWYLMRLSIVLSLAALLLAATPAATATQKKWHDDLPEREEQNLSFELSSGATVEVTDISGSVDIETTSGGAAQVTIVRSARNREDLKHRQIEVQHSPSRLLVRSKPENGNWWGDREIRQHISLKVPRDVSLTVRDVSGHVVSTDVTGAVDVSDVSGRVSLGRVGSGCVVRDISGGVEMTVTDLDETGVRVSDVSGSVEIRFAGTVNASVTVRDVSGRVSVDLPGFTIQGKIDPDNYRGTVGSGGPTVEVSDVSGRVRLAPAE